VSISGCLIILQIKNFSIIAAGPMWTRDEPPKEPTLNSEALRGASQISLLWPLSTWAVRVLTLGVVS
jgi:hypothetical protein